MIFLDYVLCEDIREEVGGKLMLAGTFHNKIVFHQTQGKPHKWPVLLRIAVYLKLLFEENDDYEKLRVLFIEKETGNVFVDFSPTVPTKKDENATMVINFMHPGVKITTEGELTLRIECMKGEEVVNILEPPMQYKVVLKNDD